MPVGGSGSSFAEPEHRRPARGWLHPQRGEAFVRREIHAAAVAGDDQRVDGQRLEEVRFCEDASGRGIAPRTEPQAVVTIELVRLEDVPRVLLPGRLPPTEATSFWLWPP